MQKSTILTQIKKNLGEIELEMRKLEKPSKVDSAMLSNGMRVSKQACSLPVEVPMTPFMKNALHRFGDLKEGQRLQAGAPTTKAETWFHDTQVKLLKKYNGTGESGKYNFSLPIDDRSHYDVDCWDNLKDNMRDVQDKGPDKKRQESFEKYSKPTKAPFRISDLLEDQTFVIALETVCSLLPEVVASDDFIETSMPFESKHTNVGFPFWKNDRFKVTPEDISFAIREYRLRNVPKDTTYAKLTRMIAERQNADSIYGFNVATGYGRNTRGKQRHIIAVSRIVNLWLNRLEAKEIECYKTSCKMFAGYRNASELKVVLQKMRDDCQRGNLVCANWDQKGYDFHVSVEWLKLLGAVSMLKARGDRSKTIARVRCALMCRSWLVNGVKGTFSEIFGRIFSGFIDTNRGGGLINAIITTYCLMKQDIAYSQKALGYAYFMLVMGDDNLFIYDPKKFDKDKYVKDMELLGFEVHPDKQQYGTFFLQNRLFKENGRDVMIYPWTRVVRSALFKESSKGLGPCGWLVATWMQLSKLLESPTYFNLVVNLLMPFDDELHLGRDITVAELKRRIKDEDSNAFLQTKGRSKKLADELFDGDPTKVGRFFNEDGSLNDDTLSVISKAVKSAYDPNFFEKHGIQIPR